MSGVPAELIDNAIDDVAWVQGSREQAEAVLQGLGGTWGVEYGHVIVEVGNPAGSTIRARSGSSGTGIPDTW